MLSSVDVPPGKLVVARTPFLALVGSLFAAGAACEGAQPDLSSPDGGSTPSDDPEDPQTGGVDAGKRVDAKASEAGCEDDDGVPPPSCDGMPAPFAECFGSTCDRYRTQLKSRLARRAVDCVKVLSAQNYCAVDVDRDVRACRDIALSEACPDPSGADTCGQIDAICTDAGAPGAAGSLKECVARVAGMTFGGRLDFMSCMTESGCTRRRIDECP